MILIALHAPSPAQALRTDIGANGVINVYSGDQRLLTLSADVAEVVAKAWSVTWSTGMPPAAKKLKAAKKPKKIKAAKPAIKAPPPPFHLSRRSALSPSKTNLFRGSVSA